MHDTELVTREERVLILEHMKKQLTATLTEVYGRCDGELGEPFHETMLVMGIRDRQRRIYWEAIALYKKEPQNWSFQRLAQCIIGEIFNGTSSGMDEGQPLYPLFRAILFSFIDVRIEAYLEMRLRAINDLAEVQGLTPEDIMAQLNVPDAFRSVYRKALARCKAEPKEPVFQEVADDIFEGLRCSHSPLT